MLYSVGKGIEKRTMTGNGERQISDWPVSLTSDLAHGHFRAFSGMLSGVRRKDVQRKQKHKRRSSSSCHEVEPEPHGYTVYSITHLHRNAIPTIMMNVTVFWSLDSRYLAAVIDQSQTQGRW
ncbi:hypothetical protein NQZ68_019904 [Dissostichus eleginoides]|nr:hypothetical protein NQZ68_019904 [Dissostichus eleginoides]